MQASDEAAKSIVAIKGILYGTADQEPQQEVIAQLSQEIYTSHVLKMIVQNLHRIDFEVSVWSKPNSSVKAGKVNVFCEKPTLKSPAKSGNQNNQNISVSLTLLLTLLFIYHGQWLMELEKKDRQQQSNNIAPNHNTNPLQPAKGWSGIEEAKLATIVWWRAYCNHCGIFPWANYYSSAWCVWCPNKKTVFTAFFIVSS